jgi:RHS repeat-associated protein
LHQHARDTDSHTTRYCYDEFDRLRRERAPSSTTAEQKFEYDGLDRRDKSTTVTGGADGTPTGFSYLGTSSTLSGETVPAGGVNDAVSVDRDSAGTPLAVTQQLGAAGTPSTKTFATDANGNPTGLEDATGGVSRQDRYVYDPYGDLQPQVAGDPAPSQDATNNPLRFNGFDYDSAVKTYDMQARDYRPDVGRFLQTDRYEDSQSDLSLVANPLTQDRYDFAGGNPVDNVELDGHHETLNGETNTPNLPVGGRPVTPHPSSSSSSSSSTSSSSSSGSSSSAARTNKASPRAYTIASKRHHADVTSQYDLRRYRAAMNATQGAVDVACLERCTPAEKTEDRDRAAGAAFLGLDGSNLKLLGVNRPIDEADPDTSPLNPVDLFTDVVTGGASFGLKSALEAAGRRGLRGAAEGAASGLGGAGQTGESVLDETGIGTTTEDILRGATSGKAKNSVQFLKEGGFDQANADFDALTRGVDVTARPARVRTATLSNGTRVTVRPFSSGGSSTLEMRTPENPAIKVRY